MKLKWKKYKKFPQYRLFYGNVIIAYIYHLHTDGVNACSVFEKDQKCFDNENEAKLYIEEIFLKFKEWINSI